MIQIGSEKTRVLVVASHPDDEVLGCGGTIAKHAAAGEEVHVLLMSKGIDSREPSGDRQKKISQLTTAVENSCQILGAKSFQILEFPDNRMDSVDLLHVVKAVEAVVETVSPNVIYTQDFGDLNIDHQIIHRAVVTATRPVPGGLVAGVFTFEVLSSTGWQFGAAQHRFSPNWYNDISKFLPVKLEALKCYGSEMRAWPHARSLDAVTHLARLRGAQVGVDAAEAFSVIRVLSRS